MNALLELERFDVSEPPEAEAPDDANQLSYEEGFNDGLKAAELARERANNSNLQEIAQTLSDLEITFADACRLHLSSLSNVMDAICDQLVPELARNSARGLLLDYIRTALDLGGHASIEIALSAEDFRELTTHDLNVPNAQRIKLVQDHTLQKNQATVRCSSQETLLDLSAVQTQIIASIRDFFESPERTSFHG